jgi:putative ABC transport system permease protein
VTVLSEAMARRLWPGEDPIGRPVTLHSFGPEPFVVIGVVGDVRTYGLDRDAPPTVYGSSFAYGGWNPMNVVWRSADPASQVASIRELVRRIDPSVALYDTSVLDDLLADSFAPRRFNMVLLACFAVVALVLAAVGLFGVMAYLVAQRTRELGVRLALGAASSDILRLILGRGMALASIGTLIGLAGALWMTRAMASLLFAVSATDPSTFTAVPVLAIVVAAFACYLPARRAMRVDPVTALRAE